MSDVGIIIRDARKRANWDQDVLATVVGCSKQYISDIERGSRRLSPRMAADLEIALSTQLRSGCLLWAATREWLGEEQANMLKEYLRSALRVGEAES